MTEEFNTSLERASCPIDEASNTEARFLAQSLAQAAQKAKTKRLPVDPGFCDICGEEVPSKQHLFCSEFCREQDAKEERLAAITGKRRVL
jgi:hypothetical protein